MARHNGVKVKSVDSRSTSVEGRSIRRAQAIPQKALLAQRGALSAGDGREQTSRYARGWRLLRLGELLGRGKVGEVVCHQESSTGPVAEH